MLRTGPLWKEMPIPRAFFYVSYRVPSKGALLPGSPNRAPTQGGPHTMRPPPQRPCQPYLKVPGKEAHSRWPNWAPMRKKLIPRAFLSKPEPPPGSPEELLLRGLPLSRVPFPLPPPPGSPVKELPLPEPTRSLFRKRDASSTEPR